MSLNGLDDPTVIDAYQTALAEAGGWFLLKYASRDEVTLLGRGTGGVPDVRTNVEGYEEKSPLYGFLQYRRRKIVLKYVPEGISRLIQARTTVQFQSVLDKFSPQDTTFEFKAPEDLTESALSSACLLHAVSGSITSSSSSLRRRRLMEIAEDAEEGNAANDVQSEISKSPETTNERRLSQASDATAVPPSTAKGDESSNVSHVSEKEADVGSETAPVHSVSHRNFLDQLHQSSYERRSSTQSARPSLRELRYAAPYRQKVKLEYRPSTDINDRPRTAGSMSHGQEYRPTAALPAGVRSRKPVVNTARPKSTPDIPPVPTLSSLRNAPPVPLLIPPPTLSITKPTMSPGAKSMNALPSSGISPEKQRLMKALELRKKQMEKKSQEEQKKQDEKKVTISEPTVVESLEEDKETIDHAPAKEIPIDVKPAEVEIVTETSTIATAETDDKKPLSADITKADSAVEMVVMASKGVEPSIPVSENSRDRLHEEEENPSSGTEIANNNHADEKDLQPEQDTTNLSQNNENSVTTSTTDSEELNQNSEGEQQMESDSSIKSLSEGLQAKEEGEEEEEEKQEDAKETETVVINVHLDVQEPGTEQNNNEQPDFTEPETSDVSLSDLKESKSQETPLIIANEETQVTPVVVVADIQAEDIPLPPDLEDDLEEAPTADQHQVALEPVSTSQEQPLPQPQPEETEFQKTEKQRRIALLEPIRISTSDYSDDENLLSDDSLMEELTTATVQEAQPVSVGKGPLSPDGEPRTPLEAWKTRAASNPGRRPSDFSSLPAEARSISATFVDNSLSPGRPVPLQAKKVNVSSGISKRIKALEMFSNNRDSGPNSTGNPSATGNVASPTASAFEKFRKRSSISVSGNLLSATPSARSSFISVSESSPLSRSDSKSIPKTNSVSVTARIVRDPNTTPTELNANPMNTNNVLDLQRSPLIVQHESSESQPSDNVQSNGVSEVRSNTSSGPNSTSTISPDGRASRFDERGNKNGSTGDAGVNYDDKKDSRRSRLMRHMPSLRSSSRKNLISPPGVDKQQQSPTHTEDSARTKAIDIGEVNVQFPDTLLWKRRYLRIDEQGYLVLTPGNMDTGIRNIVKRYHLSEFKTPCLPDEERQELPNSILLDFRNGSTLQCACESRKGQSTTLQTLVDAHSTYDN